MDTQEDKGMEASRRMMCPTCKGACKITQAVNGKEVTLPCPTCKGAGTAGYGVKVMPTSKKERGP